MECYLSHGGNCLIIFLIITISALGLLNKDRTFSMLNFIKFVMTRLFHPSSQAGNGTFNEYICELVFYWNYMYMSIRHILFIKLLIKQYNNFLKLENYFTIILYYELGIWLGPSFTRVLDEKLNIASTTLDILILLKCLIAYYLNFRVVKNLGYRMVNIVL